jgi:hypothetical protein
MRCLEAATIPGARWGPVGPIQADSAFDVTRHYEVTLASFFYFVPFWGWRQVTVLLVAWAHGCLGVHYWSRARSNYHKFAPVLLASATLLPVLALLGIWQGTRHLFVQWQLHPELLQMTVRDGHMRVPMWVGRAGISRSSFTGFMVRSWRSFVSHGGRAGCLSVAVASSA